MKYLKSRNRILDNKGRVLRSNSAVGPLRVWLQDIDTPGLAMTRSIGDHIARNIGVIPDPEIHTHKLDKEKTQIIVIGSDGLFQVLGHHEIAKILKFKR